MKYFRGISNLLNQGLFLGGARVGTFKSFPTIALFSKVPPPPHLESFYAP